MISFNYFRIFLLTALVAFFFNVCFVSCKEPYKKNNTHQNVKDENIDEGKKLAAIYCGSCHLLPDPSLLDAKSWDVGVLPEMGPRLGIFNHGFSLYPSYKNDKNVDKDFYPAKPVINDVQWQNIIDYYTSLAPDTLEAGQDDIKIESTFSLFKPEIPAYKINGARTSFVAIDTTMYPGTLVVADANKKNILRLNSNLSFIDSVQCKWPVVDIDFAKSNATVCNIGVIVPTNGKFGTGNILTQDANKKISYDTIPMFDSLRRPVQMTACDLNKDGKQDYLVCEYGNLKGALSWMENMGGDNKFVRHVIRESPGAIKACLNDYNNDGLTDLFVLFAQGDESIFLFTNKGNGKFEERQLLRFPPVYGSTYMELADFNKDGFPDIIYTCGDNADYSVILKPYHGVYIYLNDGKNNFTKKYFFHINGCFKAMARDFDGDGDLDIAAISFFADYQHRPEEGFVYFENNGDYNFKPYSIPETQSGRWLTMDAADLDRDGKTDIVLGNFTAPAMMTSSVQFQEALPFLFLKNIGK